MTDKHIYSDLCAAKSRGEKRLAVLLDPDKVRLKRMAEAIELSVECGVDYFFIGGSTAV